MVNSPVPIGPEVMTPAEETLLAPKPMAPPVRWALAKVFCSVKMVAPPVFGVTLPRTISPTGPEIRPLTICGVELVAVELNLVGHAARRAGRRPDRRPRWAS